MSLLVSQTSRQGQVIYIGLVRDISQQRRDIEAIGVAECGAGIRGPHQDGAFFAQEPCRVLTDGAVIEKGGVNFVQRSTMKRIVLQGRAPSSADQERKSGSV